MLNDTAIAMSQIAGRLREWRTDDRLTLQRLADRSGVSASTIHKIENGQSVPTITVLLKLAEGLGRRPAELLEEENEAARVSYTAAHERPKITSERGTSIEWVVDGLTDSIIQMWRVTYQPDYSTGEAPIRNEDGEFVIVCEEGKLGVQLGQESYSLSQGDSLHFKANIDFRLRNLGHEMASILVIGALPGRARGNVVEHLERLREPSLLLLESDERIAN